MVQASVAYLAFSRMQDFRNLEVWHKAHELSLDVQRMLARNRRIDAHLRGQLIRAARSIPGCVVEGCGHDSQAELARYAGLSTGSTSELEYWLINARDIGYIGRTEFDRLTTKTIEVRKMLFGLRNAILRDIQEKKEGKRKLSHPKPENSAPPTQDQKALSSENSELDVPPRPATADEPPLRL
jgi:four helix bundle protein